MKPRTAASKIITAIGGNAAFARWWGCQPKTVGMWRQRGFPASHHSVMSECVRTEFKLEAPPIAWNQIPLRRRKGRQG